MLLHLYTKRETTEFIKMFFKFYCKLKSGSLMCTLLHIHLPCSLPSFPSINKILYVYYMKVWVQYCVQFEYEYETIHSINVLGLLFNCMNLQFHFLLNLINLSMGVRFQKPSRVLYRCNIHKRSRFSKHSV